MAKEIRVAILDDHQSIIDGYVYRLKERPNIVVVATIGFGEQLEPTLKKYPTDVLLLDVNVPTSPENSNPYPILHLIPNLLESYPALCILVISMYTERGLIRAVMDAGASGYILKDDQETIQKLGAIIDSIAKGEMEIYLSENARRHLLPREQEENDHLLTQRQREVLSLCLAYPDSSTGELAHKMSVANSTVRNLLSSAYLKLEVRNRAAAIARARQLGLITPDTPTTPILSRR